MAQIKEELRCLYCEKKMTGRRDKKYCDLQCKSAYHNQSASSKELIIKKLNQSLRRNRRILKQLCPTGKATVRQSVLVDLGFSFNLFTSIFPSKSQTYYLSYDYGISPLVDARGVLKVLIIQKQDYMGTFDPWKYLKG